jgi:hypothetical protein
MTPRGFKYSKSGPWKTSVAPSVSLRFEREQREDQGAPR